MTTVSLDQIVKNILMKRRYSLHWYLDFLVPAKDGLREISFDLPIQTIRYKILPLNSNHAITLPDDYTDWSGVYVRRDQYFIPLIEDKSLNLIPNYDSGFNIQPYSDGLGVSDTTEDDFFPYVNTLSAYWFMVNWDSLGENTGRQFGGIGSYVDTFRENRDRNEIKINENLSVSHVVLGYIGNGVDADSATHIHPYAQAAIESYSLWRFKECNRTYSEGEAQVAKRDYEQQFGILRARISDLTLDKFKRIAQRNAIGIKY